MATLVANNAEASISHLSLRPGINSVGRAEGNHHVIPHASVSSRHCEIVFDDGSISVRDLGSTNGTYINDQPVQQQPLAHGQRLRFGGVEYLLEAPEAAVPRNNGLRVNVVQHVKTVETAAAPAVAHTAQEAIAAIRPVMYEEPSFYRLLPGAFGYPFNKSGVIVLVIGAILFAFLDFLINVSTPSISGRIRITRFSILISVISIGYLYAIMQRIIVHSAQGDDELPDFPELSEWWSDILLPFLFLLGVTLVSFGPGFALLIFSGENEALEWLSIAMLGFGAFYFPMALLAVAVSDNFIGLSPHIVVPSMFRVFLPYTLAFAMLAGLFLLRVAGGVAIRFVPLDQLPWKIAAMLSMGFVSLYLLTVNMRVLGLLFRSYRQRLGWLG
jgi:hypothetical protein